MTDAPGNPPPVSPKTQGQQSPGAPDAQTKRQRRKQGGDELEDVAESAGAPITTPAATSSTTQPTTQPQPLPSPGAAGQPAPLPPPGASTAAGQPPPLPPPGESSSGAAPPGQPPALAGPPVMQPQKDLTYISEEDEEDQAQGGLLAKLKGLLGLGPRQRRQHVPSEYTLPYLEWAQGQMSKIVVHGAEGNHFTSSLLTMSAPFVRIHFVNVETGKWLRRSRPDRPAVFDLGIDGKASLKTPPTRKSDAGDNQFVVPVATRTCTPTTSGKNQGMKWDEAFLLAEPLVNLLQDNVVVLFELLDRVERPTPGRGASSGSCFGLGANSRAYYKDGGDTVDFFREGWAYLNPAELLGGLGPGPARSASASRAFTRLRLHLHRYYRTRSRYAPAAEDLEEAKGFPDVLMEYEYRSHRGRERAALEVSLQPVNALLYPETVLDAALAAVYRDAGSGNLVDSPKAGKDSPKAAQPGSQKAQEAEAVRLLARCVRDNDDPCPVPDTLAWRLNTGESDAEEHGAFRLCLASHGSPLLAVAIDRPGFVELVVYDLEVARQHVVCHSHHALVYDLCWHQFTRSSSAAPGTPGGAPLGSPAGTAPPNQPQILMSCSSDGSVHLFEVPDRPSTRPIQPHVSLYHPSYVYSARPHPGLSTNPSQMVVATGGYGFGIYIWKILRQPIEGSSNWAALPPVCVQQLHPDDQSDVLCLRFSRQTTMTDNLYTSHSTGHITLWKVTGTFVGGAGVTAGKIRSFVAPETTGSAIYSFEVVTQQLLQGGLIKRLDLSLADDWVLLQTKDNLMRIAAMQRNSLRVITEMSGLECTMYPLRGSLSPDGQYVACGSESGELLMWSARDGKLLRDTAPNVLLAGPMTDVTWSTQHNLIACAAYGVGVPPLLVFVSEGKERPANFQPPSRAAADVNFSPQGPVAPSSAPSGSGAKHEWAAHWLKENGAGSSIAPNWPDEKRKMKERILSKLLDQDATTRLEKHFAQASKLGGGVTPGQM